MVDGVEGEGVRVGGGGEQRKGSAGGRGSKVQLCFGLALTVTFCLAYSRWEGIRKRSHCH